MEAQDRSRSPSRRPSRVEQMVGRWLRRSRDLGSRSLSAGRDRSAIDGKSTQSSGSDQKTYAFRFNVQIQRDPGFISHGLSLSTQTPILVQDVTAGGPADGRLVPGDQLVKINNVSADDLTPEQAAEIIRECQDTLTMTVLRTMLGPKSSFITPEKKAKLRCNPVKVRFAEEVEVNGQSQGNSLLFLPNVLKVYLENGQTKAFKFEPSTTVKDIVMTLKEKLSLSQIEHFSLVLEQQPGVTKLLLLHEEEQIQQVVQKKEAHDYRCLFRVCFLPKNLQTLLEEDPTAFEYLYLQGVNDVLQERFAVEMKCNTALRLAALHIQERLASCGYSSKTNLKIITKTWGIENFVSTTLLRNMKEKDLKKAISYHMKKCQSLQDPKQKITSVDQARINYLEELCELKSFGGKSFSATLMLQDRESTVNLLVGARYGVSQVVNRKLSILTTLTDFNSITRVELVPESDRVSLVKIYVQDIKPITLLLETAAAKDMSCLIAGYCRVFIDPSLSVFPWAEDTKKHKISAEEGYVSRCGSDSDSSTDLDIINSVTSPRSRSSSESHGIKRKERVKRRKKDVKEKTDKQMEGKKDADTEKDASEKHEEIKARKSRIDGGEEVRGTDEYPSEASDSLHTDSRALTSPSCDSLDALEEDDLLSCSTHHIVPSQTTVPLQILHHYTGGQTDPNLLAPPPAHSHPLLHPNTGDVVNIDGRDPQILTPPLSPSTSFQNPCNDDDNPMCFAELSRLADFLPSPPEASEDEDEEEELRKRRNILLKEPLDSSLNKEKPISPSSTSPPSKLEYVFNFDQNDARCYYNLVSNITPDSARSLPQPRGSEGGPEPNLGLDQVPILQPPPGFGDSSSDEEFFDARDQLASPDHSSVASWRDICTVEMKSNFLSTLNPSDTQISGTEPEKGGHTKAGFRTGGERLSHLRKRSRKRRSFMETQYTSTVSFPEPDDECKKQHRKNLSMGFFDTQMLSVDPEPSEQTQNPSLTLSSLTHSEGEPSQLETKPILSKQCSQESISQLRTLDKTGGTRKPEMEMEPDSMESKPVTDLVKPPSPNIMVVRCRVDPDGKEKEIADRTGDGKEELQDEELKSIVENGPFECHMFLPGKIGDQMIENTKIGNGPVGASLIALEQNSYIEEYILQGVICNSKSFCPPPAPPSSPSLTVLCVSQNDCLEKAKEIEPSDSTKDCMSNVIEVAKSNSHPSQTDGSVNEDEALVVPSSTRTASEEVTDSTTSDNVFDDDEASVSLNSSLSETKYELVVATRKSIIVDAVKVESQIGHSETGKRLYSLSSDYSCALYSVTSKLDGLSNMSPKMESKVTFENITTTMDCSIPSLPSPSLAKPNNLDISNNPTSPSHLLFQAWSPSIMGRLSASTLRSKIQNLPFYLSRSQEAINNAGSISPVQSPAIEYSEEKEIVVDVKDLNNVTESLDLPIESVESDESDATVTGSDLDAVSEEDKKTEQNADVVDIPLTPIETEIDHQKQPITFEMENSSSEPVREPPTSTASHFQTSQNPQADTPGPVTTAPLSKMRFGQPGEDIPGLKTSPSSSIIQPQIVVTTQMLNGPGMTFLGEKRASIDRALMGFCRPAQPLSDSLENIAGGRRMSQTEMPLNLVPSSKSETGCTSVLASECVSMVERVPLDTCGCFSEGDTFDEELTVYEFACRTQSSQVSGEDLPIITAPPVHTFLTTSSTYSPSFPRSMLSSSASEISPLLSPLFDDCLQSQTHKEIVKRLGKEQYPDPPTGFQVLRSDVDQLLSLLETTNSDQSVESQRGLHPRETCPTHFTENKRVLQIEARRLMAGCHRVVAVGQNEGEMFDSLTDSFRTLVGLAGLCLWFSSCDRCERRNAEAVSGLVDVTRSFRDFCVAAERASSKRSCQDLSTKLLAKQCTALTASVFCLTQLFRTLTAL